MRTHLLRTFYPPPAIEPETGSAANDAVFAFTSVVTSAAAEPEPPVAAANSSDDDYQLGGYAGI